MNFLRLFVLVLATLVAGCATQNTKKDAGRNPYAAVDTSHTIDLTHPAQNIWDRIRRGFAIPNLNDPLVDEWTQYYASHPEAMYRMSERAKRYLYFVLDELERNQLPTELALLPFVESAYDPQALSRSRASGLWQFIPSTGRYFNLEQNASLDQRRDPIASTRAAVEYLAYLYDFQGDWYLALASYNWGEGSVKRAIARNEDAGKPTDYLSLKLPDETRNYVPKLQAIKNIIANPKRYGVKLPPVSNTPYFTAIRKTHPLEVEVAAKLAEIPVEEFKALNAALNLPVMMPEVVPTILLPTNRVDIFKANLEAYLKGQNWKTYQTKNGESYAAIAREHNISLEKLREMNGLSGQQARADARTLWIPASGTEPGLHMVSMKLDPTGAATPANASTVRQTRLGTRANAKTRDIIVRRGPNLRTHIVRKGDTLYDLARRYSTSVGELRRLNNLKSTHLKLGQRLRVPGTDVRG
ncbi:MAG: lytic transglycosylase [Pusillimonas sp.]|nr:lytic transglycosylase [Pusillimonas sp.]MBC43168.1 lytic transglycosylase [Pusillimonas sp.]HCP76895.1 lytic transglycosylase [Pusillimonas sp.]|tara:strand:+ start:89461 stop:90867 length:1407 start_codon:yes stop_codon:yes gene_type:complete